MNEKMNDELHESILLKAKEDVYTYLQGRNLSQILGQGYDFSELREYDSADDIRHISWINSAKLGEPYVKKMYEERELNVALCTLQDARFLVGEKRELLQYISAFLAYATYFSNDLLTAITLTSDELKLYEPTKNIYSIEMMLKESASLNLLRKRLMYEKLSSLTLASKHLLFIVGDFLEPVELSLLAQQHEVIVIIIRDKFEESPEVLYETELINPQSGQTINRTLTPKAIEYYRHKMREHDAQLKEHFHENGVKFLKITQANEFFVKLEALFRL